MHPEGMQPPALQLSGLAKRFGETTAVDHVDLTVPLGSFFGLVGSSGSCRTVWPWRCWSSPRPKGPS